MDKKYPAWLGTLNKRDEARRVSEGLMANKDGWYKCVNAKKRYIAKPMPLAEVLEVLPHRLKELRGEVVEKQTVLANSRTTLSELCDLYLTHCWQRVTTGSPKKMSRRTYDDILRTLTKFARVVGKHQLAVNAGPAWFSLFNTRIAKRSVTTRNRMYIYISSFFAWAGPGRNGMAFYKEPIRFGADFIRPSQSAMRLARARYSVLITPEQYKAAMKLVEPCPLLYAIGLLGLNCAFLPIDLIQIPFSALKLDEARHDFPRGKTGMARDCALWPETIAAVRNYLRYRIGSTDPDDCVFVGEDGKPFGVNRADVGPAKTADHGNAIAKYWSKITGIPLKSLRTTLRTNLAGSRDLHAVNRIMGHQSKNDAGENDIGEDFYTKSFDVKRALSVLEPLRERFVVPGDPPAVATCSASMLADRAVRARRQNAGPETARRSQRKSSSAGSSSRPPEHPMPQAPST